MWPGESMSMSVIAPIGFNMVVYGIQEEVFKAKLIQNNTHSNG